MAPRHDVRPAHQLPENRHFRLRNNRQTTLTVTVLRESTLSGFGRPSTDGGELRSMCTVEDRLTDA